MSAARGVAALVAVASLVACDSLLVEPRVYDFAPPVELVVTTPAEDVSSVLEKVGQVRFVIVHEGVSREVVTAASYADGELIARLSLSQDEVQGQVELQARLELTSGEALFVGQGTLEAGTLGPRARIDIAPVAASITMTPIPLIESLGGVTPLALVARFATGDEIPDPDVQWTSSAPGIFEIVSASAGIARANGDVTVVASMGDVSVEQAIVVRQIPWGLSGIAPADTTIAVGESFQMRILGTDALGSPLMPGAAVWWFVPYSGVVNSPGLDAIVTAVGPGVADVQASYLGTDTYHSTVTVVP